MGASSDERNGTDRAQDVGLASREVASASIFTQQVIAAAAGLLVPAFGVIYHLSDPNAYDPHWLRGLLGLGALTLLVGSYGIPWIRRHLAVLLQGHFYLMTAWFGGLVLVNDYSANYVVGLLFVFFAAGSAFVLLVRSLTALAAFLCYTLAISAGVVLLAQDLAVSPVLLLGCSAGMAVVVQLVGYLHYVNVAALQRSEEHLTEAQRIAGLGNWEWERAESEVSWSNETCRLFGYASGTPASLYRVLRRLLSDDRSALMRYAQALMSGKLVPDTDLRVELPDGKRRVIRLRGRRELNDQGAVVRLVGTVQDVTEQKRHEAELVNAKEAAEEMVRLKDTFLTNMSHEIRTPLAGIIGYAQVLAEEMPEEHHGFAVSIEESGQRLLHTLNSVLELARLEAKAIEVTLEPVDVSEEAREAARLLHPLARGKGLDLVLETTDGSLALADEAMLHRILHNLIGNAVKFTEQGRIDVIVESDTDHVYLRVADTGIGIDAAFIPDLFSEFKQGSVGLSRTHEGIGLGLALTKRLADLLGATIDVESQRGHGSTFTVRFPRADAACTAHATPADPVGNSQP